VYWAAFTPDGRYVATANCDGTIYLFRVPRQLPEREVGEVRPLARGPAAPDLTQAKRLLLDTFADPKSGLNQGDRPSGSWGYAGGKYFIKPKPPAGFGSLAPGRYSDFACEVAGRVEGHPSGWWGVYAGDPLTNHGLLVSLNGEGKWAITPLPWEQEPTGPYSPGTVEHRAVRKGTAVNKLLVLVRGAQMEVYVNGETVCEPIFLGRTITPAFLGLYGRAEAQASRLEFERLTVWSVPPR
jgi:hypothetical protein